MLYCQVSLPKKGTAMLRKEDLILIDKRYFEVLRTDHISVLLKSKITGHTWRITSNELDHRFLVEHKHHDSYSFHKQLSAKTMYEALTKIEQHDTAFLKEVKQGKRSRGQLGSGCSSLK